MSEDRKLKAVPSDIGTGRRARGTESIGTRGGEREPAERGWR